jgi:hypothetical protein
VKDCKLRYSIVCSMKKRYCTAAALCSSLYNSNKFYVNVREISKEEKNTLHAGFLIIALTKHHVSIFKKTVCNKP